MRDPEGTFAAHFRDYGDIYSLNNPLLGRESLFGGLSKRVAVSHPELIKTVMTAESFRGGEASSPLSVLFGPRSVMVLDGEEHHRQRKLLMPPFVGDRLAPYAREMRRITEETVRALPIGQEIAILPALQRITFDVILKTVFGACEGEEIASIRNPLLSLVDKVQSPLGMLRALPAVRSLGPLTGEGAIQRSLQQADAAIYAFIASARVRGTGGDDVLSMLLSARDEQGRAMTDAELRDELVTLLLAGHETTATALAWAVDEIGHRPEIERRVREEVAVARDGKPAPFTDATIKEVLRLHPIAPFIGRRLAAPYTLGGYELPTGTFVAAQPYDAQRHPAYWEAPSEFRPARFLDAKPDPYAWLPFGAGSRRCIGMAFALFEVRIVLATLLAERTLVLPGPPARVTLRSLFFAPSGGPRVVLRPARPSSVAATA
ncbi:MAG: cytochrome P450 [Polyangiaceae bacterium]